MVNVRVLIVEDEEWAFSAAREAACAACDDNLVNAKIDRFKGLVELENIRDEIGYKYDLLILDLKLGDAQDSDKDTAKILIKMSKEQFIPVVVYSAFTGDIDNEIPRDESHKLILIVTKGGTSDGKTLKGSISDLIKLKMPLITLKESIDKQFTAISTETMEKILESKDSRESETIQAMIVSRLTAFMISKMDSLIGSNGNMPAEAKVIYPVLATEPNMPVAMGDILEDREKSLWLVASPSCDMVLDEKTQKPKIMNALLLRCFKEPSEIDTYFGSHIDLRQKERVIPLKVPTDISEAGVLIMYTKAFKTQPFEEIKCWKKIMTAASPYAEDIKATFMRDLMRIGTPDADPTDKELIKGFTKALGK